MAGPSAIRGKVVLVPFPFDDLSGAKVRPAVCLTESVGPHRHVVLAFVTSVVEPSPLPSDLRLHPGDADFPQTGPRVSSTLRLHRLMTASTSFIQREFGQLSPAHLAAVGTRLRDLFELS